MARPASTADRSATEALPDRRTLTTRQAAYLAQITGVPHEDLHGRQLHELEDLLRWRIDLTSLLFRRVCGRVVRTDPGTGEVRGVSNATVHVEDTDCSFLSYFPVEGPWSWWWWLWPVRCHREEIATTRTDRCGNFCVWVPRWDVDRILAFRRERVCFPDIAKPSVRDLIRELPRLRPNPPDPTWFQGRDHAILRQAGELLGRPGLERLAPAGDRPAFGAREENRASVLDQPAFLRAFPPPLTAGARERMERLDPPPLAAAEGDGKAAHARVELNLANAIGPFLRCRDVIVPEWEYVLDVPDITFRVTQDVDVDGDEETIYSESLFDVRWNAGDIPPVTLEASPSALASPTCRTPLVRCGDVPAIVAAGLMALEPEFHDDRTGCAIRVNRAHPGGLVEEAVRTDAQAPYAGTLQLYGCCAIGDAEYYRVLYSRDGGGETPFGLTWEVPTLAGGHAVVEPDADGWYRSPGAAGLAFDTLLLNWNTRHFPDGLYTIWLELADASKTSLPAPAGRSEPVRLAIDNTAPVAGIDQIRWRTTEETSWREPAFTWPFTCLVIERPRGKELEIEVTWGASSPHLRDAVLSAGGCGGGNLELEGELQTAEHWYEQPADTSVAQTTVFSLPRSALQGPYAFWIDAESRAFNPGGDSEGPERHWYIDPKYLYAHPSVSIAIVDA